MHEEEYEGALDDEDNNLDEEYGLKNHEAVETQVAPGLPAKNPPQGGAGDLVNYKGIYFNDEPGQKQEFAV